MLTNELAEAIRAGPSELNLCDNIFFRRRSLSNPPIFHDFLQALRENNTITRVVWRPRFSNNLSPDQRLQAYQVIGNMTSLQELDIAAPLTEASPIGIAAAAPNLLRLKLNTTMSLRYDASAQEGLVASLRNHATLEELECLLASHTVDSLDPVLNALATCTRLRRLHVTTTHPVSGEALAQLLLVPSLRDLKFASVLPRDLSWDFPRPPICNWKDMAHNLRHSHLHKMRLATAGDVTELTEHVVAIAEALQVNTELRDLSLESTTGFQDEACVALADALAIHPTLQHVTVAGDEWRNSQFALESEKSYQAFATMLHHKVSGITMTIGKPVDDEICQQQRIHYRDMVVQMMLHQVGRHDLVQSSDQTTWMRSMTRINALEVDDPCHGWAIQDEKDWELFKLECIMWMVRENPLVTKRIKERRNESMNMRMNAQNLKEQIARLKKFPKVRTENLTEQIARLKKCGSPGSPGSPSPEVKKSVVTINYHFM